MMPSVRQSSWKASSASVVGHAGVGDAADVLQPGMFRADAGIVEAGRDRMRLGDLAVLVLQQIGAVAVQHAGFTAREGGACFLCRGPGPPAASTPSIATSAIVEEGVEQPDRVAAAADRGDELVGQAAFGLQHLCARFLADDLWKSRTMAG
jgi:hypothetical protein